MSRTAAPHRARVMARAAGLVVSLVVLVILSWGSASTAGAQEDGPPTTTAPGATTAGTEMPDTGTPTGTGDVFDGQAGPGRDGGGEDSGNLEVNLDLGEGRGDEAPSRTVTIILGLTVLALAPSLLIMMTSFTRIVVVLSLVRNALGVTTIPPNQVLVGLSMFLTFFVMGPTLSTINEQALQPYLDGKISQSQALERAEDPIKDFMLANTRTSDLELMISMQGGEKPEKPQDTSLVALVPAFVISELKSAFIIGIVLFVPFVVLDLVVAAVLMALGMMMLPPVFVSLPLKLLLFVMVNGWALTVQSLVSNYKGIST